MYYFSPFYSIWNHTPCCWHVIFFFTISQKKKKDVIFYYFCFVFCFFVFFFHFFFCSLNLVFIIGALIGLFWTWSNHFKQLSLNKAFIFLFSILNWSKQQCRNQGDRTCFMCGSPDHFIRDCPDALSPHPLLQRGMVLIYFYIPLRICIAKVCLWY